MFWTSRTHHTLFEGVGYDSAGRGSVISKLDVPEIGPGAKAPYYHLGGDSLRAIGKEHIRFPGGGAIETIFRKGAKVNTVLFGIGIAISAVDVYSAYQSEGCFCANTVRTLVTEGAGWGGALIGTYVGAAIGCVILPGVGCLVGALVGSFVGGMVGEWLVNAAYNTPTTTVSSYHDIGNHGH